ncbi:hypothetical protein [Burkholderia gladioli]|uniref:hypothetical protein n=1 Tax=Burkholderia gladioli TaxID=28095 RepID=UPI002FE34615
MFVEFVAAQVDHVARPAGGGLAQRQRHRRRRLAARGQAPAADGLADQARDPQMTIVAGTRRQMRDHLHAAAGLPHLPLAGDAQRPPEEPSIDRHAGLREMLDV